MTWPRVSSGDMIFLLRSLLICLLCLGIVLPKATAALALIVPTNGQVITICTTTGIETIVLDANGTPVEGQTVSSEPCLSAHVDLGTPTYQPQWLRIARRFDIKAALFSTPVHRFSQHHQRPPCRAPPIV
ncbi:MAG: hypothetical protein ACSHXB_02355 [Sulfitobacter sp.]